MKKRLLTGLLCLVVALISVVSITACVQSIGDDCEHEWGEWTQTKAATCIAEGEEKRVCAKNSEHVETRTTPKVAHTYGEFVSNEDATCTSDGTKTATCTTPGCTSKKEEADEGSMLDHVFELEVAEEEYLKEAANCTSGDVYYKSCECGAASESDEDVFETGDPVHTYSEDWSKNDTHHWHECECGEKADEEAHTYDDGVESEPATETTVGTKLFTCTVCAQTKTTEIPVLSHTHKLVKTAAKKATCTEAGNIEYWQCSGCEKYFADDQGNKEIFAENLVVKATNHPSITAKLTTAPACETKGVITHTCPDCGYSYNEFVPAKGHKWTTAETVVADCEHGGYVLDECSGCHQQMKKDITPKLDCDETATVTKEPTCTENGVTTYVCSMCGTEREEAIAKLAHEYEETVVEPGCESVGYTRHTCVNGCNSSYTDTEVAATGHSWSTTTNQPTCTETGSEVSTCSKCGETETVVIPANGHTWISATCTEAGYCDICDAVGQPAHGHNYIIELDREAATCTENGYIVYGCSYDECEESVQTVPDSLKATGHNLAAISDWEIEEVAVEGLDCTFVTKRTAYCPDCGEPVSTQTDSYEKHKYTASITSAATCSEEGLKTYTCSNCEHHYEENYAIVADAHKWNAGVLQPDGVTTLYTCSHDSSHTKITVSAKNDTAANISSKDLNNADEIELKDATFVPDDSIKDAIGNADVTLSADKLAGEDFENAIKNLSEEEKVRLGSGEIFNFTMLVGENAVSDLNGSMTVRIPYTLAPGEDPEDIVICYIKSDTETELMRATYMEIDKVGYAVFTTTHFSYYTVTRMSAEERCAIYGHNEHVTVVPATCLTAGYTLTICRRCGEKTVSDQIDALGHEWILEEDSYVAVACDVDGYEKYHCERCAVDYETRTAAFGHTWNIDEEKSVAATCTTTGSNTYVCETCESEYSVTVSKTEHNYSSSIIAADCTNGGYTLKICDDCGHEAKTNFTSPLGHKIVDEVVEPTCLENGYTKHYCSECGETFANTDEVPKSDHEWDKKEADCEHDQVCKFCNARGEKAKGHHYGVHGKCEICKKECNHNFKKSGTVAPTCSTEGYDVYVCKHCLLSENRNFVPTTDHDYEYFRTIAATCNSPEYKVDMCADCGHENKVETSPALGHKFEGGKCTVCGLRSDLFYLSALNSLADIKGVSLKIENISIILETLEEDMITGEQNWAESQTVSLLNIVELMIYVDENGNLGGAAIGSVNLVETDINRSAVYSIKAVIDNGNLYAILSEEIDGNNEEYYVRMSVDSILSSAFGEMNNSSAALLATTVKIFPVIASAEGKAAEYIDTIIGSLINMFFSVETSSKGNTYVLDFEKIKELNESLATLTIKEVVDKYFTTGFYDGFVTDVESLLDVKMPDLLDYIDEMGISKEKLVPIVNEICALAGAPEGYDIEEILKDPEAKDITVRDLINNIYDDEVDVIEALESLGETVLYDAFGPAGEVKENIDAVIAMFENSVYLDFTLANDGALVDINIDITELMVQVGSDERVNVNFGASIVSNGKIEVSWKDIIVKIDSLVPEDGITAEDEIVYDDPDMYDKDDGYDDVYCPNHIDDNGDGYCDVCGDKFEYIIVDPTLPGAEGGFEYVGPPMSDADDKFYYGDVVYEKAETVLTGSVEVTDGEVIYNGKTYKAVVFDYYQTRRVYKYSELAGVMIRQDCGDWYEYQLLFNRTRDNVYLEMIALYDEATIMPAYMLFTNNNTDEMLELAFSIENGEQKCVATYPDGAKVPFSIDDIDSPAPLFPESWWNLEYASMTEESIFYNVKTGEFSDESHHNYVLDPDKSYEPEDCESEGCEYYVCSECGDASVKYIYEGHDFREEYVLHDGAIDCNQGIDRVVLCVNCGMIDHVEEYYTYGHMMIRNYYYENGRLCSSTMCGACGKTEGAMTEHFTFDSDIEFEYQNEGYYAVFTFTVDEDGYYDFYLTSNIYAYARIYDRNHDDWYSFNLSDGSSVLLTAGKTYYLELDIYNCQNDTIVAKPATVTEVDLSQYGCACGGTMIITSNGKEKVVEIVSDCEFTLIEGVVYCCEKCGFAYMSEGTYTQDENCSEIYSLVYYFANMNDQENTYEYVIYSYNTGNSLHDTEYTGGNNNYETTDEDGNVIYVSERVEQQICRNCENVIRSDIEQQIYDENGNIISSSVVRYRWSNTLGDLYLSYAVENEYAPILLENGSTEHKVIYSTETYGYSGGGTYVIYTEYSYNGCQVTIVSTDDEGNVDTRYEYDHRTNYQKSQEAYETVDENGNPVLVEVYEEYEICASCENITWRELRTTVTSDSSVAISREIYRYSYETDELFLAETHNSLSGVEIGFNGEKFNYPISNDCYLYDVDGVIFDGYTVEYVYSEGNLCVGEAVKTYLSGQVSYSWVDNHRWTSEYRLHDGASSCEEGVDEVYYCMHCGEIDWTEEYVFYEHIFDTEYVIEGSDIYSTQACLCCGTVAEDSQTEKYATILTEEYIELYEYYSDKNDFRIVFKFVAPETARYEFYTKGSGSDPYGYILDSNFSIIEAIDDNLPSMNFGVNADFIAGNTYYLAIGRDFHNTEIHFNKVAEERIDITEFGALCGAEVVLSTVYGSAEHYVEANCVFEYSGEFSYCINCGFAYHCGSVWQTDENCNEVEICYYYFGNVDMAFEEFTEYEIYRRYTGETSHQTYWNSESDSYEDVDENGNPVFVEKYVEYTVCEKCEKIVSKTENVHTYDSDNNRKLSFNRYRYELNLDGEHYISSHENKQYITVVYPNGNEVNKTSYESVVYYNSDGSIRSSRVVEYTYDPSNPCKTSYIRYYNGIADGPYEYYEHNEESKEIPEECSEHTYTDDLGREITVITTATEYYCVNCLASVSKHIRIEEFDENERRIKYTEQNYESYANSEDDFGYRISNEYIAEYGIYEYNNGRNYATYLLYELRNSYDESGELSYYERYDNEYVYGNYCTYDRVYTNSNGTNNRYQYTNHIAAISTYRLSEGATSCTDGLDYYNVCLSCDYEYCHGTDWTHEHANTKINPEVIDMKSMGSVCVGEILIYSCPCGDRKIVDINTECMFESNTDWGWDGEDERYEYHKTVYTCAVTDPDLCAFGYSVEYWVSYEEGCVVTDHYVYTFGTNTDSPYTVSYSYSNGYTSHNHDSRTYDETVEEIDGLTVTTRTGDNYCSRCGIIHNSYILETYKDSNGNTVKTYRQNFISDVLDYTEEYNYTYDSDGNRLTESYHRIEYDDADGTSRIHESKYDYLWVRCTIDEHGTYSSKIPLYSYSRNYDYWEEYSYEYPDDIYCKRIETYRNSDGDEIVEELQHRFGGYDDYYADGGDYYVSSWIEERTCTQYGLANQVCVWCLESREQSYAPYDHNYNYDSSSGRYTCYRCGLENFTGADGDIALEDLTAKRGNGENYVIGYWFQNGWDFEYTVVLSLVYDENEEPIILDVYPTDDGESLVTFSVNEVRAAVEALGYNLCANKIRINFVPLGSDTTLDYAITLDPHAPVTRTYTRGCGDGYLDVTSCVICAEDLEITSHLNCNFSISYNNYTDDYGVYHQYRVYTCTDCGYSYSYDNYGEQDDCVYYTYNVYVYGINGSDYEFTATNVSSRTNHEIEYNYSLLGEHVSSGIHRDGICKNCNEIITSINQVAAFNTDQAYNLTLDTAATSYEARVYFTPTEDGTYVFYSSADGRNYDTYGYIYDAQGSELYRDDDSAGDGNFKIECDLKAGETYILASRFYSTPGTASYVLNLEKVG